MTDPINTDGDGNGDNGNEGDPLELLVGEGKKFKTVSDLARGKLESDDFIEKLKGENVALRALVSSAEDTKRSTQVMEELLAQVKRGTPSREPPGGNQPPAQQGNQSEKPLTARDVAEIFKVLKQQEAGESNLTRSLSRVQEKYKDKAEAHLRAKAKELDLDYNVLLETARRSPAAFFNLIGENNSATQQGSQGTRGSVNSAAVVQGGLTTTRNLAYYDKLKNDMGATKFVLNRNLQLQMHKDMQALGDEWDAKG